MSLEDGSELELDLGLNTPCGVLTRFVKRDGRWKSDDEPAHPQDVCFCCGQLYCIRVCRAGLGERTIQEVVQEHERSVWS